MHRLSAILRFLAPFWLLLAGLVLLALTGFQLHWTPRFSGLAWGLTEMAHVWLGWIAAVLLVGYLVHHLHRRWGDWRRPQRILGLVVVVTVLALTGSGWLLSVPLATRPGWLLPLHFVATFVLIGLVVTHARPRRQSAEPG